MPSFTFPRDVFDTFGCICERFCQTFFGTFHVSMHAQLRLPHTARTSAKNASDRHRITRSNEISGLQQATKLLKSEAAKFKRDISILF